MSTNVPTRESLKEKAKVIRKFLKEKCDADVSHSHCIELVSKVLDFNDWNTASASLKSKVNQTSLPFQIRTVGEMKSALAGFKDSDIIDGMYDFKIGDFLESLEDMKMDDMGNPEDTIIQEFSFVLEHLRDDHEIGIASFKLNLENEEVGVIHSPPTEEICDYWKNKTSTDS